MSDSKFTKDGLRDAFQGAGEKLKSEFGRVAEEVDVEALKKGAEDLADEAASFVRKYPLQTAAGMFAAGCLLGALFGRSRE